MALTYLLFFFLFLIKNTWLFRLFAASELANNLHPQAALGGLSEAQPSGGQVHFTYIGVRVLLLFIRAYT